jgi:UDP-glucuronate 4-epimerase
MKILVTGAAGFIGSHVAGALLDRGDEVVGLDNLGAHYDVALKEARLARLSPRNAFKFVRADITDRAVMAQLFADERPQRVVHLAAQAGVRYSIECPEVYVDSNIVGFLTILEGCRRNEVEHLVYASSSSVYGANTKLPFAVGDGVDHPVSLYAATKKANELMAHTYAHLYGLPVTGLRFFTVYGPWGRPDMSMFKFTRAILEGKPVEIYNHGRHARDFTYIDDISESVVRAVDRVAAPNPGFDAAAPDPATSSAPYRLYNIGNHSPVDLMDYVAAIEKACGRQAEKQFLAAQPGDVEKTFADIEALKADIGFEPRTPIETGVRRFVDWYREFYRI